MTAGGQPPAMVLAAGLGTRLGELGRKVPKPLVEAGGEPLVRRTLRRLAAAGIERAVINLHHLGGMIEDELGDGSEIGVRISYSREPELLDVAGGIANALPLLGDGPFVVANADVLTDLDFGLVAEAARSLGGDLACLFLGDNPDFRPNGDFSLEGDRIRRLGKSGLTYLGCAAYSPVFFAGLEAGRPAPIMPLWLDAIDRGLVAGRRHSGSWLDVGTPERVERSEGVAKALDYEEDQQGRGASDP